MQRSYSVYGRPGTTAGEKRVQILAFESIWASLRAAIGGPGPADGASR